jgi:hypothetical protein
VLVGSIERKRGGGAGRSHTDRRKPLRDRHVIPPSQHRSGDTTMRYVALWFLGVPVSVIVLLALFNVI